MIEKDELVQGIRFAGRRAAAAAENCKDWNHQLGHQWTTRDAFAHVAAVAGGAQGLYPLLDGDVLNNLDAVAIAANNANAIKGQAEKPRETLIAEIVSGADRSAEFVAGLDEGDLAKVVKLGGYEMAKAEVLAQIWIHHQIAHAYEASARWPLQ